MHFVIPIVWRAQNHILLLLHDQEVGFSKKIIHRIVYPESEYDWRQIIDSSKVSLKALL